jgi:protein TonB
MYTYELIVPAERNWWPYALMASVCIHLATLQIVPFLTEFKPVIKQPIEVQLQELPPVHADEQVKPILKSEVQPVQKSLTRPQAVTPPEPAISRHEDLPVLTAQQDAPADPQQYTVADIPRHEQINPANAMATAPSPNQVPATNQAALADSSEAVDEGDLSGYGRSLFERANKYKNYPQIAIRRNMEGSVRVSVKIVQGHPADISIATSSTYKVLDEQAVEMVRKALADIPMADRLLKKNFTVVVPVEFKLAG